MKPEKLFIFNLDTGDVIDVLFNPTEYTVEESNSWEEQARERQKPELQFTSQSLKKVSMELFFDTYEQKIDVRTHTNKIARLLSNSIGDRLIRMRPMGFFPSSASSIASVRSSRSFPTLACLYGLR
jgi:hypothetical protein